ncbi:hypothetical protein KIPB_017320, partial [Kipferlia bialata]|eukprot:g17320.t1
MTLEQFVKDAGLKTQCERVCTFLRDTLGVESEDDLVCLLTDPDGLEDALSHKWKPLWRLKLFRAVGVSAP